MSAGFAESPFAGLEVAEIAKLNDGAFEQARSAIRSLVSNRREQVALLRRRRADLDTAEANLDRKLETLRERREIAATALKRREKADASFDAEGRTLVEEWATHFGDLQQLRCEAEAPLAALADWVAEPEGDNPARLALHAAQQEAGTRLAARQVELGNRGAELRQEQADLEAERASLEAGRDIVPPAPHTRAPGTRDGLGGAPLWQLIDFQDHVGAADRAGLEAALEASGLLDAWITL